jgi:hypothetical protein
MRSWLGRPLARIGWGSYTGLVRDTSVDCAMHATAHNKDHHQRTMLRAASHVRYPSHDTSVIADREDPLAS